MNFVEAANMVWMILLLAVLMPAIASGLTPGAQKNPSLTQGEAIDDDAEILDIDDPRVAAEVRVHALGFRDPVRCIAICGPDIMLFAEDGEVVDICTLY